MINVLVKQKLAKMIINMFYLCLDLETTSEEKFNRIAHWRYNQIIAIGMSNEKERYFNYLYPNKLDDFLIDEDIIVGANLKFDLLYLWHLEGFQDWLKNGGKIWDVLAVEYYLSGQTHKYPKLRDIAVNKYECSTREKVMEQYWDKGIDTKDIPQDIVMNDLRGDVIDTERVYLEQVKLVRTQPMLLNFIEVEMNLLLLTTEMEYNGFTINRETLINNINELKLEADNSKNELLKLVGKSWYE